MNIVCQHECNEKAQKRNSVNAFQATMEQPSRTIVHAKLEMTDPDSPEEVEADAAANDIVQGGKIARSIFAGSTDGGMAVSSQMESRLNSLQGGGQVMPDGLRNMMEHGFNRDFSQVRLHTDSEAASLSTSIHAKAFTHGNDIYFNQGQFSPNTSEGQKLMAHELTHVVQGGRKVGREGDSCIPNTPFNYKNDIQSFGNCYEIKDVKSCITLLQLLWEKTQNTIEANRSEVIRAVTDFYTDLNGRDNFRMSLKNDHITNLIDCTVGLFGAVNPVAGVIGTILSYTYKEVNILNESYTDNNYKASIEKFIKKYNAFIKAFVDRVINFISGLSLRNSEEDLGSIKNLYMELHDLKEVKYDEIQKRLSEIEVERIVNSFTFEDKSKAYYDFEDKEMEYSGWDPDYIDILNHIIKKYGVPDVIENYNNKMLVELGKIADHDRNVVWSYKHDGYIWTPRCRPLPYGREQCTKYDSDRWAYIYTLNEIMEQLREKEENMK